MKQMKKKYYWILMEEVGEEGDLSRCRLVPRGSDGCYSISHDKIKEFLTWNGGEYGKLNNL